MADTEKDYWKEGAFLKETHCASLEATTKGGKLNKKNHHLFIDSRSRYIIVQPLTYQSSSNDLWYSVS